MNAVTTGLKFSRLTHRTRTDEIRDVIEEHIGTGGFPPGMRLHQRSLAEFFSVSRTPLREALIQLSSVGIVSTSPHRVPEFSPARLLEMFEVMAEFEAMCARHAARRMSDTERSLLVAAHEESGSAVEAEDVDAYWRKNECFHRLLYTCSHSNFLAEQSLVLFRRLRPYRRLELQRRNRIKKSFSERSAIVDALVAADGNLAADRLRKHVFIQGDRFTDLLAAIGRIRAEGSLLTIQAPATHSPSDDQTLAGISSDPVNGDA
jgi:DNA-binding GntR family transcriptional regulator